MAIITCNRNEMARRRASENYRENDAKGLFEHSFPMRMGSEPPLMVDYLAKILRVMAKAHGEEGLQPHRFADRELNLIVLAIGLPTLLYIDTGRHDLPCFSEECEKVEKLQMAVCTYCHASAYLEHQVQSDRAEDWLWAYNRLSGHLTTDRYRRMPIPENDARRIGELLRNATSRMVQQADVKRELPNEPTVSKFKGKTLKRKDGGWIRVEDDGVTFTCPTRRGDEVKEESYRMDKSAQLEFLDALLDRFEKNLWHKPPTKKSEWQNTLFKRGPAAQFLRDGHIACWGLAEDGRENQGQKGAIRLKV